MPGSTKLLCKMMGNIKKERENDTFVEFESNDEVLMMLMNCFIITSMSEDNFDSGFLLKTSAGKAKG